MPTPDLPPESLEAMAFQLLLHKITGLEQAVHALPPLLAKIIAHLEAQQPRPEVEIADYAQLYPEVQAAAAVPQAPEEPLAPLPPPQRRLARLTRWFMKES